MSVLQEVFRNGAHDLVDRLSPQVAEIVRQDLIQSVGNALRHQAQLKVEEEKLDRFVQNEIAAEWGAW